MSLRVNELAVRIAEYPPLRFGRAATGPKPAAAGGRRKLDGIKAHKRPLRAGVLRAPHGDPELVRAVGQSVFVVEDLLVKRSRIPAIHPDQLLHAIHEHIGLSAVRGHPSD